MCPRLSAHPMDRHCGPRNVCSYNCCWLSPAARHLGPLLRALRARCGPWIVSYWGPPLRSPPATVIVWGRHCGPWIVSCLFPSAASSFGAFFPASAAFWRVRQLRFSHTKRRPGGCRRPNVYHQRPSSSHRPSQSLDTLVPYGTSAICCAHPKVRVQASFPAPVRLSRYRI